MTRFKVICLSILVFVIFIFVGSSPYALYVKLNLCAFDIFLKVIAEKISALP